MFNNEKNSVILLFLIFGLVTVVAALIEPIISVGLIFSAIAVFLLNMFLSGRLKMINYVMILIASVIMSPIIKIPGMFADIRLDDIWLLFGLFLLVIRLAVKKDLKIIFPYYCRLFLFFIAWIVFTIFISSYKEPNLYSMRDWTEVYKAVKILTYLLIMINLRLEKRDLKRIISTFVAFLLLSALFGIMQYFNFLNINTWLTPLYIFETKVYNLEVQRRVVGTFGNPNIFGSAMMIGVALSLVKLLERFKFSNVLVLLAFFVAITLSLSRTALVASVLLLLFMIVLSLWKSKKKGLSLFLVLLTPVIGITALKFAPEMFYRRISRLGDLSTDTSYQARLKMWQNIWETRTKSSPIIGTGPTSNMKITFDNEWLELLTYYGFIGIVLFILIFLSIYFEIGRINGNEIDVYGIAGKGIILVFCGSMLMLTVYNQLQLMPIIVLVLGAILSTKYNKEDLEHIY